MAGKISPLRILVIDDDTERANMLTQALEENGYRVITHAFMPGNLIGQIQTVNPNAIIIGIDSPGQDTLKHLSAMSTSHPLPIIMFTRDGRSEMIQAATRAGVSAYVVDGLSRERVQPIIEAAITRFHELQALREELEKAKTSLEERKVIERAKGIVMEQRGCTEAEAYRSLQKIAMDRKKRLAEIAQDVLAVADVLKRT